jgi:hypothetical protein
MNHSTLTLYFNWSLWIGLPLGLLLLVLWQRKIYKPLVRHLEKQQRVNLQGVAMKTLIASMPGLIACIVCVIPAFYFNHLLKQHDYCLEVVRVNKGMAKNDAMLVERCGRLDVDELFERSKALR